MRKGGVGRQIIQRTRNSSAEEGTTKARTSVKDSGVCGADLLRRIGLTKPKKGIKLFRRWIYASKIRDGRTDYASDAERSEEKRPWSRNLTR